jgi:hypothetical protein
MSNQKIKPSRWYYSLAALLPVLGCLITTAIFCQGFPYLPGALETIDVHNMTQVIVPGSADITFAKKGAYAVYYEYRSLVDGVQYINAKTPPPLICSLASGGGQQGPILAAAGAKVTVLDNSPRQLEQDRLVAFRHALPVTTVEGDMAEIDCDTQQFTIIESAVGETRK